MSTETNDFYSVIGRRVAELRKKRGLTQRELASRLARKRTQAWVSTLESGHLNANAHDLFEIATILETTVGEFFCAPSQAFGSSSLSVDDLLNEVNARLPIEMPMYLQSELGKPDPDPIDYQYTSSVPRRSVSIDGNPLAQMGKLYMMVVERYYDSPNLAPTDLLTYSGTLIPHPDPDTRVADRILVKTKEPHAGLRTHPCIIRMSGEAETTLSGHPTTVFASGSFVILGVLVLRRVLYRPSVIRGWLRRQYGIGKDERLDQ